ncbi:uracil phosphoribosyltransferase-domain-containing protein [Lasiosphaeria hispida]|uniref:Uracil phosphoribosyltransferase-domain-containing protein n=1 Tax=Lasiosphaeria hispida TaxID=260671 RepID=A0AAJ0MFI6_9PEZI|nr:uracil phosphoribosyltransferase-domain-containing protein [Lasiosphaeria hispida]
MSAPTKPVVIGIYGLPGSGKSLLTQQLKQQLEESARFVFHEGSAVIASLVPGGLTAFQALGEQEKTYWRELAIERIASECGPGQPAVVAGHFMFWSESEEQGTRVCTQSDLKTFTHIIYLEVEPELVLERRSNDTARNRSVVSLDHIRRWQRDEVTELRELCWQNDILFTATSSPPSQLLDRVERLLVSFCDETAAQNLSTAGEKLDGLIDSHKDLETALVFDADRTLSASDTGALFWDHVWKTTARDVHGQVGHSDPLKAVFSSPLGYSYTAFRQAMLLYEEASEQVDFELACDAVAASLSLYPGLLALLQLAGTCKHRVTVVVVTCGLHSIWHRVMQKHGLDRSVKVIGSEGGLVVTDHVKAALVSRLREKHGLYVWAFGDSVLDLPMMKAACQAVVVVGDEKSRSKTMDKALADAIEHGELTTVAQVLLPSNVPPRLGITKLPVIDITNRDTIATILRRPREQIERNIQHATSRSAAKLLMTPTRDATIAGPALREAHRRVGWYLGMEMLADIIGTEEFSIPHVQGHQTTGHRLHGESQTLIVALMRGGEPLALGVNDAFPSAMFLHAKQASDVRAGHLNGRETVLLVDSVVNSGKSIVEFVQRVRQLEGLVRVVVVAGVVQARAVSPGSILGQLLVDDGNLGLVALRLSDNKFTGRGNTDTGNRLFNTTHLD